MADKFLRDERAQEPGIAAPAARPRRRGTGPEARAERWRPSAWGRFLGRSAALSWQAAAQRPRAAAEVTALHAAILVLARCSGRGSQARTAVAWTSASWLLAITHLRALDRSRRAGRRRADGQLARRSGTETMFGGYADSIADAAFWAWFAARHETSDSVRAAAFAAWAAPAAGS